MNLTLKINTKTLNQNYCDVLKLTQVWGIEMSMSFDLYLYMKSRYLPATVVRNLNLNSCSRLTQIYNTKVMKTEIILFWSKILIALHK